MLNQAVDTAYENEKHARGQHDEWYIDVTAAYALFRALTKEEAGKHHTDNDYSELESEGGFGQLTAQLLNALGRGGVRGEGHSEAIECFDNSNEGAEERHDTIGWEWSAVGHIVKGATQNMIVREFE